MRQLYPKLRRLTIFFVLAGNIYISKAQDLPGASAALVNAPPGSIIIAMDNTNQATSAINSSSGTYLFNLKAYGFVTLLRNAGYYVRWAIKTGKAKDDNDFSVTAERITPSYVAPQLLNFKAGPFVLIPPDTLGVSYMIDWFNSSLPDSCKVKIYRTTSNVIIDSRYMLGLPPRIALLHDSCDIHRNFLEMASVPTVNYDCLANAQGLITGCYTIATEPHVGSLDIDSYTKDSVYNFIVNAGGNFLAECEGLETFEDLSFYQTVGGGITRGTGGGFNNYVFSDNPDMAYGQYEGSYRPRTRGAIQVWRFNTSTTNNFYPVVRTRSTANGTDYYTATVSKLTSGLGSLVFYLGNHEFYTTDCHTCISGTNPSEAEINGIRLYLNAVQIPSRVVPCTILEVKLSDFTATKQGNETVLVKWKTTSEINNDYFIIEHSTDGKNFKPIGKQLSNANNGGSVYSYMHSNPNPGINYYRLRSVDKNTRASYSSVRKIVFGKNDLILTAFPNPATNNTTLMIDINDNEKLFVKIIDGAGRTVKQQVITIKGQLGQLDINGINSGLYIIVAKTENGDLFKNKLIVKQ